MLQWELSHFVFQTAKRASIRELIQQGAEATTAALAQVAAPPTILTISTTLNINLQTAAALYSLRIRR